MIFADVIIDISVKSLDRPFQYIVPEEMEFDVDIGSVVKSQVQAGKSNYDRICRWSFGRSEV